MLIYLTVSRSNTPPIRVLIFSHFSERDGAALLRCIAKCLQENTIQIQHVILTSYDERRNGTTRIGKLLEAAIECILANSSADRNLKHRFVPEIQEHYAEIWKSLDPEAKISSERTIEDALDRARKVGDPNNNIQALITGSLHLVSGALCLLEPDDPTYHKL